MDDVLRLDDVLRTWVEYARLWAELQARMPKQTEKASPMDDVLRGIADFRRLWGELVVLSRKKPKSVQEAFDDIPHLVDLRVEVVDLLKALAGVMEVRGMNSTALWNLHDYFDSPSDDQWAAVVTALHRLEARVRAERADPVVPGADGVVDAASPEKRNPPVWSDSATLSTWAKRLGRTQRTLMKWSKDGSNRVQRAAKGSWRVNTRDPLYDDWIARSGQKKEDEHAED
ncbi:MAG: hypothetical protein NTW96_02080 [Planctomycetia bacterium]|nr:hypothetical protein [Planctomycetia bacterium]